jgi:TRAP-type mannitol/chloroaromatic compound transport system permease small subunit
MTLATRIDAFTDLVGRIAAWTVFALVLVMAGNVLARYGFATGSVWAQELEWHLMAPIALFGAAYAMRHGEHVRVDVLYAGFSPRGKAAADLIGSLLCLIVCLLVVALALPYVAQSFANSEGSANPGGIPFRWALKALIPISFLLVALQCVADTIRAALRLA